jgi:CHAT domain-containing protein
VSAWLLDVQREPGGVRVSLSPLRLSSPLVGYARHAVDLAEVARLGHELRVQLGRANQRGQLDQGAAAEVRKLGLLLFDELLPAPIKERLRALESADLLLRADAELSDLPWELLHTGAHFLSLRFNLGRLLCDQDAAALATPRPLGAPLEVLVLADPRGDLDAAYEEGVALRDLLDARHDTRVTLRASEVSRADLRENLREYDILHYAGHAEVEGQGEGWWMSDGRFTAQELSRLRGGRPFPSLVFANACGSGRQRGEEGALASLARGFLQGGVRHFIGAHWELPDEAAHDFAVHFYRGLGEGRAVGAALRGARLALSARCGEGALLWASYCLYGDPGFVYFSQAAAPRREDALELTILEDSPRAQGVAPVSAVLAAPPPRVSAPPELRGQSLAAPRLVGGVGLPRLRGALWFLCTAALCGALGAGALHLWGPGARAAAPRVDAPLANAPLVAPVAPVAPPVASPEPAVEVLAPLSLALEGHVLGDEVRSLAPLARVRGGEALQLSVTPSAGAHVLVILLDERAAPQLLFPHPEAQQRGWLEGGQRAMIPGEEQRWRLSGRAGVETALVLGSQTPWADVGALLEELKQTYAASAGGGNLSLEGEAAERALRPAQARALRQRQQRLAAIQRVAQRHGAESVQALTWFHTR